MTARQYLLQLKTLTEKLWILHEEIERRRARLESTTIPLKQDRVQSSSKGDSMADGVAALADKELLYEDRLDYYERLRAEIVEQILALDHPVYSGGLYRVYVEQKPRSTIAAELHYTENYISILHGRALEIFAACHPELRDL